MEGELDVGLLGHGQDGLDEIGVVVPDLLGRVITLEAAFLALTGTTIRDERADAADQMRQFAKMWRR